MEGSKNQGKILTVFDWESEVSVDSNDQKLQETKCSRKWDFAAQGTWAIHFLA